jgi:hypothetical protein
LSKGLVVGPGVGLVFGLLGGLTFGKIETRIVPNEGIRRSARNALFAMLVGGLVGGLTGGGETCLSQIALRLGLIRNGSTPWNYVRFLDYAAERILLRKVGGGYAFIHRMLLNHFAALYVERSGEGETLEPDDGKVAA